MLHEYLERKRRDNVSAYNASGACHICGSSCRNKRGFSHAIECTAASSPGNGGGGPFVSDRVHSDGYGDSDSMVPRADRSAMKVCSCFDQGEDDPDYSPYSVRLYFLNLLFLFSLTHPRTTHVPSSDDAASTNPGKLPADRLSRVSRMIWGRGPPSRSTSN